MKAADPTIELLSSYPRPGVFRGAGALLDYVSPHHYDCADLAGCEAELESIRGRIRELAPGRKIRVAVTEWNTTAGDAGPRRARLWTLENALACSRYQNLIHRHCDLVAIANRSNLINSFCSGFIQTDNHRLYKTPTYHAQQLYATMAGDRPLRIDSSLPAISVPDLSATMAADGKSVVVFAVNDQRESIERPLDFSAFGLERSDPRGLDPDRHPPCGRARRHQQLRRSRASDPRPIDLRGRVAALHLSFPPAVADRDALGGAVTARRQRIGSFHESVGKSTPTRGPFGSVGHGGDSFLRHGGV